MAQGLIRQGPMEVVGFDVWVPSMVLNHEYATTKLWILYKEAWGYASSLLNSVYSLAWTYPDQPWRLVAAEAAWRKQIKRMRTIMSVLSTV